MRAATGHEAAVQALLAQTANPEAPNEADVSQPSDVLTARAAAAGDRGTREALIGPGSRAMLRR